ncbi:hypothetical protein HRI_001669000 [Hibiscus trionum]|uniref:Uncharacterized protein n=1 Tax=Hibiscus trionum TaxID=183268 RepID=A0A9W7LW62_HIBTR|nr:hypothetical protein HRI_001669000 [Hibiscus trionum]
MASQQNSWHGDVDSTITFTDFRFQNLTGQCLTQGKIYTIHGYGVPPETIQDQETGEFKHVCDSTGSAAGVAYTLEHKLKWVTAWSNHRGRPKTASTMILPLDEEIDWEKIKGDHQDSDEHDHDEKFGYTATAMITQNGPAPIMMATLKKDETVV